MDDLREAIEELGPHADIFEEIIFMGAGYKIGGMANATIGFHDYESIQAFNRDQKETATKKGQRYLCLMFRVNDDETTDSSYKKKSKKGPYGELAKQLKLSNFFRTPDVWRSIAPPEDYHAWVIKQPSAMKDAKGRSTGWDHNTEPGIDQSKTRCCDPAHWRDANTTGIAIKPEYSVIPLLHKEHLAQTNSGYSSVGGKEWFEKQRIKYVQEWCWITLREKLGYESWSDVPPKILRKWTEDNELINYIPRCYYHV